MSVLRLDARAKIRPFKEDPNRFLVAGERVTLAVYGVRSRIVDGGIVSGIEADIPVEIEVVHECVTCELRADSPVDVEVVIDPHSDENPYNSASLIQVRIVSTKNIFLFTSIPKTGFRRISSWLAGESNTEVHQIEFETLILQVYRKHLRTLAPPQVLKIVEGFVLKFTDEDHQHTPIKLTCESQGDINKAERKTWLYQGKVYSTLEDLTPEEVRALMHEVKKKAEAKVGRAVALMRQVESMEVNPGARRPPVPDDVKILVWRRDEGKCVRCRSNQNLEFDHIIPVVMGGSNTARNLQLLCEGCNRAKGGSLV